MLLKCTTDGEEEWELEDKKIDKIKYHIQLSFIVCPSWRDLHYSFDDPPLKKQWSLNVLERLGRMQVKKYSILSGVEMCSLNKTKKFHHKQNFTDILLQCILPYEGF